MNSTSVAVKQEPPRRVASPIRPPPDGQFSHLHLTLSSSSPSSALLTLQLVFIVVSLLSLHIIQIPQSQTSSLTSGGQEALSGTGSRAGVAKQISSSVNVLSPSAFYMKSSGCFMFLHNITHDVFSSSCRAPAAANTTGTLKSGISVKSNQPCKAQDMN